MALPVYLVHYEAPAWIRSASASVLASDIDVDLTVVSNSGPVEVSGARVISTTRNLGYAGGANVGLRDWLVGSEPYAVVGSHDLHVEVNTLRLLVEAAESEQSFGILAPVVSTNWVGLLLGHEGLIELRASVSGTCLLLRRSCIESVGLFDEVFESYGEDVDLCERARRRGWKVGRVSGATASGLGTSAGEIRQLNMIANSLLLGWRSDGYVGLSRRYLAIARRLGRSIVRRKGASPAVLIRALFVGTRRLGAGIRGPKGAAVDSE